jgi:hypothetical protein
MSSDLPRRVPPGRDGPVPRVLSVGSLADRIETVASSILATVGVLRALVADWDARAGLLEDRGDKDGAQWCRDHAAQLRTVLNTGKR